MKNIVLFQICGADFLCIPNRFIDDKPHYNLCWVKKITDNINNLSFDYEVIHSAQTIEEAKEIAKLYLDLFY